MSSKDIPNIIPSRPGADKPSFTEESDDHFVVPASPISDFDIMPSRPSHPLDSSDPKAVDEFKRCLDEVQDIRSATQTLVDANVMAQTDADEINSQAVENAKQCAGKAIDRQ